MVTMKGARTGLVYKVWSNNATNSVWNATMEWYEITVLLGLICIAGIILLRAVRQKKWCPGIYGDGKNNPEDKSEKPADSPGE